MAFPSSRLQFVTTCVIVSVGLFDVFMGLRLLAAGEPWLSSGFASLAANLPERWYDDPSLRTFAEAAFSRLGAFSLSIGAATVAWGLMSHGNRRLRTALLLTYTVVGLSFAWSDHAFFSGTSWHALKQVVGAWWALGLVAHFADRRRTEEPVAVSG